MEKQKCFSCIITIILVIVLLLIVLAGIYFVSTQEVKAPTISNSPASLVSPTPELKGLDNQ